MTENFKGKKVLLTGCTSGIGAEVAVKLDALGAIVYGIGRQDDKSWPGVSTYIKLDLSDLPEVEKTAEKLAKVFENDGLDYFIGAAGTPSSQPLEAVSAANLTQVMKYYE